jgi:hypothetical protein
VGVLGALAVAGQLAVAPTTLASDARAESDASAGAREAFVGPVLPASLSPASNDWWVVSVAAEQFGRDPDSLDALYGVSVMYRLDSWGPHLLAMSKPNSGGFEDSRFLAGAGLRGYLPVLGTEMSYGVSVHAEARLEDHFWLAYATPLELGVVLYSKNSWDLELFFGARRAFAGELINHFLIDPNGFDNENAADELERVTELEPWRGFVRLVFGRRLD